jgi:transcriptional regulator with GAF, ATPase, and Fis domain
MPTPILRFVKESRLTPAPAARLAEVFVEVADTLVDEFDLIEFLHMVTQHTSELVQADSAGLLLADHHGRLQLMAASDERAEMLELYQVQANQGPCQDCFRQGQPVIDADLATADKIWPHFAPRAVAAGFRSVHAFPLRLRQTVIGALNLFGNEVGTMAPADARVIQALADIATIGILQERTIRRGEVLTEQLQAALNSRVVIEQAKGVLAQSHGVTTDEAFDLLRDYARSHQQRLGDVAQSITEDLTSLPDLTTPRPA